MFIGHFGVGFAAKKATPVSLGLLFIAVQFLDLLWPIFLLLNIEQVTITHDANAPIPLIFTNYPYSHSLVMAIVWSFLFGLVYWIIKKNGRNALILGLCVFSHWVLDLMTHLPDLPLYFGENAPKVGLQLWRFPMLSVLVEALIFVAGIIFYVKRTVAKNKAGKIGFWLLVSLLVLAHIANLFSAAPPSVSAVAWGTQAMWLFVLLAFWVDKNRVAV